jgi:Yip1-like protein
MATPRDLLTVVYAPRETMRRVLDASPDRWTIAIAILATICSQFGDPDMRGLQNKLPGLTLTSTLGLVVLGLIGTTICWLIALYLFGWLVTLVGRRLGGEAAVADVRAALAWGTVPVIWALIIRIPMGIYAYRFVPDTRNTHAMVMNFILSGGCTFAVIAVAFELLLFGWVLFVMSNTVAESLRVSWWRGLATMAIIVVLPIVIVIAAQLASR